MATSSARAGYASLVTTQPEGIGAALVTIETDLSFGLHAFSIIGLPDKAMEEARDRISSAIKHAGFKSPKATNRRIIISLSPASLRKEGSQYDLPIALCYLAAAREVDLPKDALFIGEIGLDGTIRGVPGVLSQVLHASKAGMRMCFVPSENASEAALVSSMAVYGVSSLTELIRHLRKESLIPPITPNTGMMHAPPKPAVDMADIKGQETAKRLLEIAAAGKHNLVLYGPPGTGKTMLARALAGILPPLRQSEMLEVTAIHSSSNSLPYGEPVTQPPFRAPHHTVSYVAIVGGGSNPRPGEVTLAHRGVLFLDEFAEFDSRTLEALRQPLEDRCVTITRSRSSSTFPADCMLVAAMNPAHTLTADAATALRHAQKQARKISRPIADRLDLWVEVPLVPHETLSALPSGEPSSVVRERVQLARSRAEARLTSHGGSNTDLESSLSPETWDVLKQSSSRYSLSPRAYYRMLRVGRTIADLAGSDEILSEHLLEGFHYRPNGLFGLE